MKQVWQAEDGKTFEKEKECQDYEKKLQQDLLRQKWMEQNNVEELFGKENQNYHSISTTNENDPEYEYEMSNKIIFRSIDNQYFKDLEECKLYEKGLRNRDISKIIDKERVWRSAYNNFYATEEECQEDECTAFDGTLLNTIQERIDYENEEERLNWQEYEEGVIKERQEEYELEIKKEREVYGVNWGDEPWEQPDEENLWDPNEGSPN